MESSRSQYLWEAVKLSGCSDPLQEYILSSLLESTEPYDIQQMIELCRHFAVNGNNTARETMRKAFQFSERWNTFIGAEEIILLDGTEGFLFVVDTVEKKILNDEDYWQDDWILTFAEKELVTENVQRILSNPSEDNLNIKTYLDSANNFNEEQRVTEVQPRLVKTYEELKNQINDKQEKSIAHYMAWGKNASEEDFIKAAQDFLVENKKYRIHKYLKIFIRRPFPLGIKKIIDLADSRDRTISYEAIRVLRNIRDEQVHELAVHLWNNNPHNFSILDLLEKNYTDADYPILEKILYQKHNKYLFHDIGFSILDIFENHFTSDCLYLLVHIYNFTWCSN